MKSNRSRNIIISIGVILLVSCVYLGLILLSGIGASLIWPFEVRQDTAPATLTDESQVPIDPAADEVFPDQANELPDELAEEIFQIESQVTQIRGLSITEPVNHSLITSAELGEIVANDFFSEYSDEDAWNDVLILSLLGLLPEKFDLRSFYKELYSEQIAGFYDSETKEIYIVKGMTFGGSEKLTYAHEFTHVLQDQAFGFDEGLNYNEESCEEDSERCAAIQALIEGDATLTEILWFQTYATRDDYDDLMRTFENFDSPILDAAPPYMVADLYFPYDKGLIFIQHLYDQGGFAAVDAAYQNPPLSTEQILHPERYPDEIPVIVTLPDLGGVLGEGWTLYDQNIMGEWYIFLILNMAYDETYRLSENVAQEAADGWGGDSYAFYINEHTDEVIFVMDTIWDTAGDAEQFADAFSNYADLRWNGSVENILGHLTWQGPDITIVLLLEGDRTVWVIAPDDGLVESILLMLQ